MILFIEDDKRWAEVLVDELTLSGFKVAFFEEVDCALKFFNLNYARIELILLDIMMSWGTSFSNEETDDGLRTGVLVFERIRKIAPAVPLIILTNINKQELSQRFPVGNRCWLVHKSDFLPHELAEAVRNRLAESSEK